jgi:predicted dehydrogenase
MLKIGVLGAGHLGKIHIKLLKEISDFQLIGFYDSNLEVAASVEEQFGIKAFNSAEELINEVDAVDIVTPTLSHYLYATKAIRKSKHVFIEKPIANTPKEGKDLVALAKEANIKAMVGHVERFNPAFLAVKNTGIEFNPMFIEAHRLAQFNPRGTDVSVVLDLMVHDIDIILNIVKATVKKISASGVSVVSKSPDIANARIEFDNGCVANLTASRISMKQMRKIRFFQKDTYISIDLFEKQAQLFKLLHEQADNDPTVFSFDIGEQSEKKYVKFLQPEIPTINAIKMELELFAKSILNNTEPEVTFTDGYNALHIAHQIMHKIEKSYLS